MTIFLWALFSFVCAQPFWVEFKDKGAAVAFEPRSFFAPEAVARHCLEYGAEYNESDLPVCEAYLSDVRAVAGQIGYASRWLNGVYVPEGRRECLAELPCVARVYDLAAYAGADAVPARKKVKNAAKRAHGPVAELARAQLSRMNVEKFWNAGYNGDGVIVAVFDVGFWGVNKAKEFAPLFDDKRILDTWDFVRKTRNVYGWSDHGTQVLSCIAGTMGETPLGAAPAAKFLLARTERVLYEPLAEELWWLEAAEWAEKNGAHVINSSLGYGDDRYDYRHMDGSFSIVARAAANAVAKGMVVVNAAGNDGAGKWKYITTPADVAGVLTVGGTDPATDAQIPFSSMGPTADGRLKPEVCAYGKAAARGRSNVGVVFGTSFSSPLVAGFVAAVRQLHPDWTAKQVYQAVCQAGHLFPYFDYSHGYGVPQADKILEPTAEPLPTFSFLIDDGLIAVSIDRDALAPKHANLYWHVQRSDGRLRNYGVRRVNDERTVRFPGMRLEPGETLRVHFEGFTGAFSP